MKAKTNDGPNYLASSDIKRRSHMWLIIISLILMIPFACKAMVVSKISLEDESGLLAMAVRFWQGDAPFRDDWFVIQMHGIVLMPFATVFRLFHATNDGIILFFRITYLLIKEVLFVFCICRLHRNNQLKWETGTALVLWHAFSPFNIDTITYQEVPILLFAPVLVMVYSGTSKKDMFLIGIFYAISVLCQPFFVFSYPVFLAGWMCFRGEAKSASDRQELNGRTLFFHFGILCMLVYFCFVVFRAASLSEVIHNIPYIFRESDHVVENGNYLTESARKVGGTFKLFIIDYPVVTLLNTVYCVILGVAKSSRMKLWIGMPLCLTLSILYILGHNRMFPMNEMFIPFLWTGMENLFYNRSRRYLNALIETFLFMIAVSWGTNTEVLGTSAGICPWAMAVLFSMDHNAADHVDLSKKNVAVACYVILGLTVLGLRLSYIWWGEVVSTHNFAHRLIEGPYAGMYADDGTYNRIMRMEEMMSQAKIDGTDILFCGSYSPYVYLYTGARLGTPSTGSLSIDYAWLKDYYVIHPERFPNVVYYETFDQESDGESWMYEIMCRDYTMMWQGNSVLAIRR